MSMTPRLRRIDNYELSITTIKPDTAPAYPAVILSFAWADAGSKDLPEWAVETVSLAWSDDGLVLDLPTGALLFPTDDFGFPGGPLKREMVEGMIRSAGGMFACAFNQQGDPIASMGFPALVRTS